MIDPIEVIATHWQVVRAQDRGDACYQNRKGWYWHRFTSDWAIDTSTVTGPFVSQDNAVADAKAKHAERQV